MCPEGSLTKNNNSSKNINIKIFRRIIQTFFLFLIIFSMIKFDISRAMMSIIILIVLLTTLFFRTVFCGWVCPAGTVFVIIRRIGKIIGKIPFIKPINKIYKKWVKNNIIILNKIDKYARYVKHFFLLWILQAAIFHFVTISRSGGRRIGITTIIYIIILFLGLFIERSLCRYACPLGVVIGLVGKLSPTKIVRDENFCTNCNICSKSCPLNIDVANKKSITDADCNICIKCIDDCPVDGALKLKFTVPLSRKNSKINKAIEKQII